MEIKKRETVYQGYYRIDQLLVKSKKTGQEIDREQFIAPNSVGVLIYHPKKEKIILVRQFRIGPEKELLEIVAGKREGKNLDSEATARREVEEETGYRVEHLEKIHGFYTSPGPYTEYMDLYYAEVKEKISAGGGLASEVEEIEVLEWSVHQFLNHGFNDAKSLIAQQWMALRLNNSPIQP